MRLKSVSRLMLGLLWLGTVSAASAMDDDTAKRLADIEQQLGAVKQQLSTLNAQPQSSALLNLQSQVDALKAEVRELRGQLDVQSHNIETTQKRQTDLYQDLDARLRKMISNDTTAVTPASATAADEAGTAVSAGQPGLLSEEQSYQAALGLFKQGDYAGAIASFKQFGKSYPASSMAASAQYWIGNAYFSTKDFKNALLAQQKLITTYPASPKVPDALLNMSSAQVELGDMAAAKKTLQMLVTKYGATPAAGLARKRLELLK